MNPLISWFLTLFLAISSAASAASPRKAGRLGVIPRDQPKDKLRRVSELVADDYKVFYYNQTLDHFAYRPESYATFKHKYIINSKDWGGADINAPIFVCLGEESSIEHDLYSIGFLNENAPRFKAMHVYIEHRFYGESIPYGLSQEKALEDANIRGLFTSAQALADYAEVILHVKKTFGSKHSPVIVFGGSYGGMLAAWFRLKYPHIAHGALASSAPIFLVNNFVPLDGYFDVVNKDFRETSETCYETIKTSWAEMDRVASETDGLLKLSKIFDTCKPLKDVAELKTSLIDTYAEAAQYNSPSSARVARICRAIDNSNSSSILGKIYDGLGTYQGFDYCQINWVSPPSETDLGWTWQSCSDIPYSLAIGDNTMFQPDPAPVQTYVDDCIGLYGVPPRPNWISTYFGGRDAKLTLRRFGSNIIFSNGLVDPFSSFGVLEDLSSSLHAVYTINGSHCLDIVPSTENDPEWLVNQRNIEISIIAKWLAKYYADLIHLKGRPL